MRYAVLPSRSPVLIQQSSLTPVLTPQLRRCETSANATHLPLQSNIAT